MTSRTRIPNKVIWALEDIMAFCIDADDACSKALNRAEERQDLIMVVQTARLRDYLSRIERVAGRARRGEYSEIEPGLAAGRQALQEQRKRT